MSDFPLPLPPDRVPEGARDWRTHDTVQWAAAGPPRWTHPLWSIGALLLATVWNIAATPDEACTPDRPCGTAWTYVALSVLALVTLYWIARQPRLALVGLVVTGSAAAWDAGVGELVTAPWDLALLAAWAFALVGLVHRLAAAGRQRALAETAAGPDRHALPPEARAFSRGRFSFVLASVLLAVAVLAFWRAEQVAGAYETRAATAARVSAEVTRAEVDDEDVSLLHVALPDGGTRTVEALFPEDHPVGSTVELAVDGEWVRLVAEPYDVFGWEVLLLVTAVPGVGFLANGTVGQRRHRRLDTDRLPVLRVLVREGREDGRTWVYAADDLAAARPVLSFNSLYVPGPQDVVPEAEHRGPEEEAAAWERQREEIVAAFRGTGPAPELREAVLFGAPRTGDEAVFLAPAQGGTDVAFERSVTPVKPVAPGLLRGRRGPRRSTRSAHRSADIARTMTPGARPLSWSADRDSRLVGGFLLLVQGGGMWALLDDGFSWQWLLLLLGVPWLVHSVSTALNWRVTADRDGVWVCGPWRARHLPWDGIATVRHRGDALTLGRHGQDDVELSPVGFRHRESSSAARAADTLRALVDHPHLRPTEAAGPGEQGMPLGPVVVATATAWALIVLLL
ncbi:hypothetical protein ACWD6I_27160 [Streptomyces sp. NPDC002454]